MNDHNYLGTVLQGKYRIISLLGTGGMGSVFLAQHVLIGKKVAVKFLHTKFAQKDELITRFYREAQAAAEIGHRNIVDVFDMGVSDRGEPYIIMEYLEGESLAKLISRVGPLDLAAACGILEPTLLALEAAHSKGIVHRDLKPENIFLVHRPQEAPIVKLIDFGVSKFADRAQTHITATGALLGTPAYMSPEQVRGAADLDRRTDIYSIGVILYKLLTGRLPYDGEQYHEFLAAALTSDPIPPRVAYPEFPQEAEALVLQALQKDRLKRPQSAREMLEALSRTSVFPQRVECLRECTSDLSRKTLCASDQDAIAQGTQIDSVPSAAAYVKLVKQSRTGMWTNSSVSDTGKRKYGLLGALVGGAVVVATTVVLLFVFWGSDHSQSGSSVGVKSSAPDAAVVASAKDAYVETNNSASIQVEVRGMPKDAQIFYNDIPVPMNPFRVEVKETIVPLRIKATGYQDFITSIVPSVDQVVKVEMMTVEQAAQIPALEEASKRPLQQAAVNQAPPLPSTVAPSPKAPQQGSKNSATAPGDQPPIARQASQQSSSKSTSAKKKKGTDAIRDGKSGAKFNVDFD